MILGSIADVTGAGATVQLSATSLPVKQLFLSCSTATARFGDTNVTASRGVALSSTTVNTFTPGPGYDALDLVNAYVYLPAASVLSISYEPS